jgi:hypothetical protein
MSPAFARAYARAVDLPEAEIGADHVAASSKKMRIWFASALRGL